MSLLIFANNAQTVLAGPIASTSTTCNLAAGTGSEFPNPAAGQYFVMTFNDQATGLVREIVWVTARSGDTCTILRAQEGTTARDWLANDIAANWWTAGQAQTMIQVAQLQLQATNFGLDGGSTNALSITLPNPPTSLGSFIGAPVRVKIANTNTGSATLAVNSLAATLITNPDGTNLVANQLIAGHIFEFVYNGTTYDLMTAPYELLRTANTWTQVQTWSSGGALPNAVPIQAKDTGGVAHNIIGSTAANLNAVVAGSAGFAISNFGQSINIAIFDNATQSMSLQGGAVTNGFTSTGFSLAMEQNTVTTGWRNDGTNSYFLMTNAGGSLFNDKRPITINNTTGALLFDSPVSGSPAGSTFAGVVNPNAGILIGGVSNPIGTASNGSQQIGDGSMQIYAAAKAPLALGVGTVNGTLLGFFFGPTAVAGITTNGSSVVYNTVSDRRRKRIRHYKGDGRWLRQLPIRDAEYKDNPTSRRPMIIADELQELRPTFVIGARDAVDKDGKIVPQQVDLVGLVPSIIAYAKHLEDRIDAIETRSVWSRIRRWIGF